MGPVRVGVVGLGQIAQIMHLPYLYSMPGFEIVALCDLSPRLLDGVGALYHVRERYTDAQEMLAHVDLDAVVICSNFDHADIALAAIDRGKHVFVEKPLCETPARAREIAEAGDRAGVKVMVAYMKRYDPGFWRWQREIEGLRDIRMARAHDFCHNNNWVIKDAYDLVPGGDVPREWAEAAGAKMCAAYVAALGGKPPAHIINGYGLALGLGVHDITIVRGSFGDPKGVLAAHVAQDGPPTTTALLDYGNFCLTWAIGNTDTKQMDQELAVWSRDAMVSLRFESPYIRNIPTELTTTRMAGDETVTIRVIAAYRESFQNELAHFHECVTQDRKPLTDAWEGLRDIEWLLEIVKRAW